MITTKRAILVFATLILGAGTAVAKQGDPIPGRDIVLEGDPYDIVVATGKTDAKGTATFKGLKKGRYIVAIPDTSTYSDLSMTGDDTVPAAQFLIIANGKTVTSQPIPVSSRPTKPPQKAYATDKGGKKIIIILDKPGGTITLTLTEAQLNSRDDKTPR